MHELYNLPLRSNKRRDHWRHLVTLFEGGTLKRRSFCEENKIKLKDFDAWRYRFKSKTQPNVSENSSASFVPVELNASSASADISPSIKLSYRNGIEIEVPSNFESASLTRILSVLGVL